MSKSKVFFRISLDICVKPDEDSFHAFCPGIPAINSCGDTQAEALANCKNAAIAYTLSLLKHHEPLPIGATRIVRVEQEEEKCKSSEHFNENIEIPSELVA